MADGTLMPEIVLPATWTPIAEQVQNPLAPYNLIWVTLDGSPVPYDDAVRLRESGKLLTALRGNVMVAKAAQPPPGDRQHISRFPREARMVMQWGH